MTDDKLRAALEHIRDCPLGISAEAMVLHLQGVARAALASATDEGPLSFANVRKAITDSYYDTRNEGGTMETAADLAATRVLNIVSQTARPAVPEALDVDAVAAKVTALISKEPTE